MESLRTLLYLATLLLLSFQQPTSFSVQSQCVEEQQLKLLQLKESLIFDPKRSTKLTKWKSSTDCCAWPGVSCNIGGLVVGLDLSEESISGGLHNSSSLFHLHYLESLNMAFNDFNSSIPTRFEELINLRYLNMSYAGFIGQIPIEISYLTNLVTLDLSSYSFFLQLENPNLATLVQNLVLLRELYLDGVNISADGKDWCKVLSSSLPNLQALSLCHCYLSGPIDPSLANLSFLSVILLNGNNFSAPVPEFFASFSNLTSLELSVSGLLGRFPESVLQMPSLEILSLQYNEELSGTLPEFYPNQSLRMLLLSGTNFSGGLPRSISNLPNLSRMELRGCNFTGQIPSSVFDLSGLEVLSLSSNNLNGSIQLDWVQKLGNLAILDLSQNNLTVVVNTNNSKSSPSFPKLATLNLASCNLKVFPDLGNQSQLQSLDLSGNQISGEVPSWVWDYANQTLGYLNLSGNHLVYLPKPLLYLANLYTLDLHDNQLRGNIPLPPSFALYVDYSKNNFTSLIPSDIGNFMVSTIFLSLANNNLTGIIPDSLCNAYDLQVLDLSDNAFTGIIPSCLTEKIGTLGVLNLRRNLFNGSVPDNFQSNCTLQTLDLSSNMLQGAVPKSLANCAMLEVLDLGNNQIKDEFPCALKNKTNNLRVLILQGNQFHGSIGCPDIRSTWPMLQIIDLASNHFNGSLPKELFLTLKAMMEDRKEINDHIKFRSSQSSDAYYQDSVTVTEKNLQLELVKILTIFKSIDFSCNNFQGPIPDVIGGLKELHVLNLSHNALSGPIPPFLGNLSQLESLDLSVNRLIGSIPQQLASLTFLSVANFSHNKLSGGIPQGTQLQSFSPDCFEGNDGLCGVPLPKPCSINSGTSPVSTNSTSSWIEWNWISFEVGYIVGLGAVIWPLMFCKRWRKRFSKQIDSFNLKMFPKLEGRNRNCNKNRKKRRTNVRKELVGRRP